MPKLSVWLARASLIHMGVGFLFGALLLHHKGIPIYGWSWSLLNPHIEIMIYGWTMQFVMGMACWILPRFPGEERYGKTTLGWCAFGLLNAGVLLTVANAVVPLTLLPVAGRLAVLSAGCLFAIMIWPRVKPIAVYGTVQHS
jgi:hypothetical protein